MLKSAKTNFVLAIVFVAIGACSALDSNLTFVCQGSTETIHIQKGEISGREISNTRRFIAIKNRKIGNNECMLWNKGRVVCQSSAKSIQNMDDTLAYQLNIDRESGDTYEHIETPEMQRNFRGKCTPYNGPKI